MKNKKTIKKFIALFSLILIISIGITAFFIFKKTPSTPIKPEINYSSRYNLAQTAIYNKDYSQNYNGSYNFAYVAYIDINDFSETIKSKIFKYYSCNSSLDLIGKLYKQKLEKYKNYTIIINNNKYKILNDSIQKFKGNIYGNDDLSILYNENYDKIYNISLTNIFNQDLVEIKNENQLNYRGKELFVFEPETISINSIKYSFDVVMVFNLQK